MTSWDTKTKVDPRSSAGAVKKSLSVQHDDSGERDMDPIRPIEQIHKDLGRHLPQTDGEPDMDPLPKEVH